MAISVLVLSSRKQPKTMSTEKEKIGEILNPLLPSIRKGLDPEFLEYYDKTFAPVPPPSRIPLSERRANPERFYAPWNKDLSKDPGVKTFRIPSRDGYQIKVQSYMPIDDRFGKGPWPVHVNFHGMWIVELIVDES